MRVNIPTSLEGAREVSPVVLGEITSTAIAADPAIVALSVSTYSKMVGPVAHLFAEDSFGVVYDLMMPAGTVVGLADTAYVSTAGNDSTAVVGNLALPFKTINNALLALNPIAGGTVMVGPGTFFEDVNIPDMPNCTIIGSGIRSTVIQAFLGAALNYRGSAPGDTALYVSRITLSGVNIAPAVTIGGGGQFDLGFDGFTFDNVEFLGAGNPRIFAVETLVKLILRHCIFSGAPLSDAVTLYNVGTVLAIGCVIDQDIVLNYDTAIAQPIGLRGLMTFKACSVGNLQFINYPNASFDRACHIRGAITTNLAWDAATPQAPRLVCGAVIGDDSVPGSGGVTLFLPIIAGPAALMLFDFTGAQFLSNGLVQITNANPVAFTVIAQHTVWRKPIAGSVLVQDSTGGVVQLILDIRNSHFDTQASFAVAGAGACIDRSKWLVLGTANPGGVFGIAFLPYPNAIYMATIMRVAVAVAIGYSVVAKAVAAVQVITGGAGGTVDLIIIRSP